MILPETLRKREEEAASLLTIIVKQRTAFMIIIEHLEDLY